MQGERLAELSENTYNWDCNLSQDLLFTAFGNEDNFTHCILQIHGGCDARGGYTKPVVFKLKESLALLRTADGRIRCPACDYIWETDNASTWIQLYDPNGIHLEDMEALEGSEGMKGTVVVTKDHQAFCPVCGKGILEPEDFED